MSIHHTPPPDPTAVVQLRDGAVTIGGRPILRHIDLTVRSGEFVALMGANGSGKSTLVRALTGLLPLATGDLRLFGTAYADFRDWHADSRLACLTSPESSSAASRRRPPGPSAAAPIHGAATYGPNLGAVPATRLRQRALEVRPRRLVGRRRPPGRTPGPGTDANDRDG